MVDFCLDVLNQGKEIHDINKTNIMLIPRVGAPRSIRQYRPISLCNVIYKIISRMLVNRFRQVLDLFIDET